MQSYFRDIFKNTAFIYAVEVATKVFIFSFIIYAARTLGVKSFGELSYALTLYVLLQVLSDFGLTTYIPKNVAQNPPGIAKLFKIAFHMRLGTTVLLLFIFLASTYLADNGSEIRFFLVITGSGLLLSSYAQTYILTVRGLSLMKLDGAIRIGGTFLSTALSLIAVKSGMGLKGIAVALFFGNAAIVIISFLLNRRCKIVDSTFTPIVLHEYWGVIKGAMPYMVMVVLVNIFTRIDTILLKYMKGPIEVGLYHASSQPAEAVLIFQIAFAMVILPVLSKHMGAGEMDAVKRITHTGLKMMGYVAVFFCVVTFMTADKVIELLYFSPEYKHAVMGLKIFAFISFVIYITTPVGSLLLASPLAKRVPLIQACMVLLSIALNFFLIPRFGFQGAAVVRLLTEVFGLLVSMVLIDRAMFRINYGAGLLKPAIAGLSVAVVIYFAKSLLFIPFYLIVYGGVLYLLGGISSKELAFMREVFTREERA